MSRMNKLSNYKTTIHEARGMTRVVYHSTEIVAWNADKIELHTGGWQTVTTKRKMNQAARQFNLGYSVFQHDGDWFIRRPDGGDMPFDTDEVVLDRKTGHVWQAAS